MANNRMWLVNPETGARILIAKHFGERWKLWGDFEDRFESVMTELEANGDEIIGSNNWRVVYEHGDPNEDDAPPVKP